MIVSKDCFIHSNCKKFKKGACNLDDKFCIKLFKLDYLYNEALLSEKQRKHLELHIDADGTDRDVFLRLKDVEINIENFINLGNSLYLYSDGCGNGKTAWAIRLIQSYFNSIWHKCDLNCKALFVNVPRFLLALKENITNKSEYVDHIVSNVLNADLVVWDEIGTKAVTTFEHEHLLSYINNRIDNNKSQIFTSNLNPTALKDTVGERLYSRVVNTSLSLEFKGADKRGISQ